MNLALLIVCVVLVSVVFIDIGSVLDHSDLLTGNNHTMTDFPLSVTENKLAAVEEEQDKFRPDSVSVCPEFGGTFSICL